MNQKEDTLLKVCQSIIANQIATNFNHEIKHTEYFKSSLKSKMLPLQLELIKAERKEFDKMFGVAEGSVNDVYKALENLITEFAKVGISHSGHLTAIIKAYQKDPASIEGIAKKINRT